MCTVVCLDKDNRQRYAFECDRRDIAEKLSQATGIPVENVTIDPAEECIQSDVLFVRYTIHDNQITLYFKFLSYDFQDCMQFVPETQVSEVIDVLARKYNTKPENIELYFNSRMLTRNSGQLIDNGICHEAPLQVFFLEKRRMLLFYRNQCTLEQDQIRFFASEGDDWRSVLQERLSTSNFEIVDSGARVGADPFRQPEERLTVIIDPEMRQPVKLSRSQGARSVYLSPVRPGDTVASFTGRMSRSLGLTRMTASKHLPNESLEATRKSGTVIEIEVDDVKVVSVVSGNSRWKVTSNEAPTGAHLLRYVYQQYFNQSYEAIKRARREVPNLIELFWTSTECGKKVVTEDMTFNDFPDELHLSVLYRFDFGRLTVDRYLAADQSNSDLLTYARTQLWKGEDKDIYQCTCKRVSYVNVAKLHIVKPKKGKRDPLEVDVRMGEMDWNSGVKFRDDFTGKISVNEHNRDYIDVIRANLVTTDSPEDSAELMVEDVSLYLFGQPLVKLVPLYRIAMLRNIVLEVFVSPLYSYHVMVNQMLRMEATVRFPRSATCDHVYQHFRKIYGESVSLAPFCDGYGDANWYEFLKGECHFVVNVDVRSDGDRARRTIYQSLNSHAMESSDSNVFEPHIKDNQIEPSIPRYIITKFGTRASFSLGGKGVTELKKEIEEKFLANVELTFDGGQDSEGQTLDPEHIHANFITRTLSFQYISSDMNEHLTTLNDVKLLSLLNSLRNRINGVKDISKVSFRVGKNGYYLNPKWTIDKLDIPFGQTISVRDAVTVVVTGSWSDRTATVNVDDMMTKAEFIDNAGQQLRGDYNGMVNENDFKVVLVSDGAGWSKELFVSNESPLESIKQEKNCYCIVIWKREFIYRLPGAREVKKQNLFFQTNEECRTYFQNLLELKSVALVQESNGKSITGNASSHGRIWVIPAQKVLIFPNISRHASDPSSPRCTLDYTTSMTSITVRVEETLSKYNLRDVEDQYTFYADETCQTKLSYRLKEIYQAPGTTIYVRVKDKFTIQYLQNRQEDMCVYLDEYVRECVRAHMDNEVCITCKGEVEDRARFCQLPSHRISCNKFKPINITARWFKALNNQEEIPKRFADSATFADVVAVFLGHISDKTGYPPEWYRVEKMYDENHTEIRPKLTDCIKNAHSEYIELEIMDPDSCGYRLDPSVLQDSSTLALGHRTYSSSLSKAKINGVDVCVKTYKLNKVGKVPRDHVLREIGILSSMRHPTIVPLLGYYSLGNDTYCLITELMKTNLSDYLKNGDATSLPLLTRKIIAYGIVKALSIVYQKHCAYGDLKKANVLIEEWEYGGELQHRPRLCDFSTGTNTDISRGYSRDTERQRETVDRYRKDFGALGEILGELLPEYEGEIAFSDMKKQNDIQAVLSTLKDKLDEQSGCWREYLRYVDVDPDFNPRSPDVVRPYQVPSDKFHE